MFKIGDLVILSAGFSQHRHPPMGTYGFVKSVENVQDVEKICKQLVKVEWAHPRNNHGQIYMDCCLELAASA